MGILKSTAAKVPSLLLERANKIKTIYQSIGSLLLKQVNEGLAQTQLENIRLFILQFPLVDRSKKIWTLIEKAGDAFIASHKEKNRRSRDKSQQYASHTLRSERPTQYTDGVSLSHQLEEKYNQLLNNFLAGDSISLIMLDNLIDHCWHNRYFASKDYNGEYRERVYQCYEKAKSALSNKDKTHLHIETCEEFIKRYEAVEQRHPQRTRIVRDKHSATILMKQGMKSLSPLPLRSKRPHGTEEAPGIEPTARTSHTQ